MIKEINARNFKLEKFNQELTGRDIFTGPNGCGKSARLQALQIAMFGHIPSVGKQANATMGYALDGKMEVELKSDSMTVSRIFRKKISKKGAVRFSSNIEILPLGVEDKEGKIADEFGLSTDLIDISNFIQMSARQRKDMIANLCASSVKDESTKTILSSSIDEGLWNDDLSDIDNINNIESHYKEKLSSLRLKLKEKRAYLNEKKSQLESTDSEKPEELQKKIDDVESKIEEYNKFVSSSEANIQAQESLKSQLESINNEILQIKREISSHPEDEKEILKEKLSIEKDIDSKKEKTENLLSKKMDSEKKKTDLADKYSALNAEAALLKDLQEKFSGSNCPFVKKKCPEADLLEKHIKDSGKNISNIEEDIKKTEAAGKKLKSEISSIATLINEIAKEVEGASEKLSELEKELQWVKSVRPSKMDSLKSKLDKASEVNKKIGEMKVSDTSKAIEMISSLKTERSELVAKKENASNQKNILVDSEKANIAIQDLEDEIEKINEVLSLVGNDGIKGDIIQSTHKPLVSEMNNLLGKMGYESNVLLERDSKDAFDICLVMGGSNIRFDVLSEGQKTILSAAFLCAVQTLSGAKVKVVLIEASELDDENFSTLTEALSKSEDIDNILIARYRISDNVTLPTEWTVHTLK